MKQLKHFLILMLILSACNNKKADIEISNLRCEYLTNPEGIGVTKPRLSWELGSDVRGLKQKSYHILVASSLKNLEVGNGDLWDSKEVESDASVLIEYDGKPLESRNECFWKVKLTTNQGDTEWSEPAKWSIALLNVSDRKAKWIGLDKLFKGDVFDKSNSRLAARYLRKEFKASSKPVKATAYISGLGLYELFINGERIGEQELSPTPTEYLKTVKYNTFDVTDKIKQGDNAIGTILGNGRFFSMRPPGVYHAPPLAQAVKHYGFPKMIFQLELTYSDGTTQTLTSDNSWKVTADGPILSNNEFDGEEYDARKEMPGWNNIGFNDTKWVQAELVDAPGGKLEAQLNPNIKVMETIKPVNITEPVKRTYILDMGQNMVGCVRMKVKGKSGEKVKLRFAETTNDDGSLYLKNIRGALVTDIYTLKGGEQETWEPKFTYHGFRFVEITGYPGKPSIDDFDGLVVYDEMEVTGHFETSNQLINQIHKNAYWGIRGNYRGMPTDCPQRDERMAWLGDRAVGSYGESFIFDNYHLYSKWLDDIKEAQLPSGSLPDVAPTYWSFYDDNMTWPAAYPSITKMLYRQFGDTKPIISHYESIKKWMGYMKEKYMQDSIITKDIYGDWCMPPESPELIHSMDPGRRTDGTLLATAFYYRILNLLEEFAEIQGKQDEAKQFAEEAATIKKAYNDRFFNEQTAQYSNNTVTANLISLCHGLVPDEYKDKVFKNIEEKIEKDFNNHVSTGLIGIQWLMRGLSDYGRADIAYQIVNNRDYPSWGYMIEKGATTIWELWNGDTADPTMNSHNHVMLLGDLVVWFYEYLGGIRNAADSHGFKKIELKPYPVEGLDFVNSSYKSVYGLIKSNWKKENELFKWSVTIPGNTTATIYVPAKSKSDVLENGKFKGMKFIKMDGEYAVFEAGSGNYELSSVFK